MIAALLLAGLTAAPVTPAAGMQDRSPTASELKTELDLSLRWLRSVQDAETGGYGDGTARMTARALIAFARSPRAYRRADGPFVARALDHLATLQRADGAFPDADLQRRPIDLNTALVLTALVDLSETGSGTPHARALAYLGSRADASLSFHGRGHFESAEAARAAAQRLLGERSADGSWPDGFLKQGPSVLKTARSIVELTDAWRAIAAEEKESAPPAEPQAAQPLPPLTEADRARVAKAQARGAAFLVAGASEGRWGAMGRDDAGITAMVLGALLSTGSLDEAGRVQLDRGLSWLRVLQKEDGAIHDGALANYVTSASILALARAGRPEDVERISRARAFLERLQADEGEGYDASHHYYGGVGYGGDERPDLSNLQMALEALAAAGLEEGDPTFQKALRFLERAQNRSESNDLALEAEGGRIVSGNDGGGVYAPGDSKAGFVELRDGERVPRSYGSMTYALLKGYLFAGLDREDARVEAAWKWLRENYTLDVNPGFESSADPRAAYQGLYYYFYTMARALDLYGEDTVVDVAGTEHAWRAELAGRIIAMQRPDGSWVNENSPRWWEGNPVLATAYALLTLEATVGEGEAQH